MAVMAPDCSTSTGSTRPGRGDSGTGCSVHLAMAHAGNRRDDGRREADQRTQEVMGESMGKATGQDEMDGFSSGGKVGLLRLACWISLKTGRTR